MCDECEDESGLLVGRVGGIPGDADDDDEYDDGCGCGVDHDPGPPIMPAGILYLPDLTSPTGWTSVTFPRRRLTPAELGEVEDVVVIELSPDRPRLGFGGRAYRGG